MRRRASLLVAVGLVAAAFAEPAFARTLVAGKGANLQRVLDRAEPGDRVILTRTFRSRKGFVVRTGGISITGRRMKPGFRPALEGPDFGGKKGSPSVALRLEAGVDGVTVRNLVIEGFGTAIAIPSGNNISLAEMRIQYNGAGLVMGGPVDHLRLHRLLIVSAQDGGILCRPGPCNHVRLTRVRVGLVHRPDLAGVEITSGDGFVARQSSSSDNTGAGFLLDGTGVVLSGVTARDNGGGAVRLSHGGRIENCITELGIILTGGSTEIVNCALSGAPSGGSIVASDPSVRVLVRNNLVFGTFPVAVLGAGATLIEDHNFIDSSASRETVAFDMPSGPDWTRADVAAGRWQAATGNGMGDVVGTQRLTQTGHLRQGPAMDAGSPDRAPAHDLDGRRRPRGGGVDIGPYEDF
jgi:hypothetical protein